MMSTRIAKSLIIYRVVPKPRALVLGFSDYVLLSLNGYVAAVLCGNDPNRKLEAWIMKEYGVMNSWVKDFTIASYVPKILKLNGKYFLDDFDEIDESTATDLKIIRNGNCSHVVLRTAKWGVLDTLQRQGSGCLRSED
ncbi:hypothetical protein TIFTF001_001829 [Ficus carica]|uniref:F-box associated domain-containing protein n=1 Tax=Ficus carica TaxID=3494 RepID=A0AA87Z1S8_FICCA|nr:hypothetical protein TIFTF001_001829 [Ficus carica]